MIEIVTHCYNPPGIDIYSQMLKHQVASLVHHRCDWKVRLTVCYSPLDEVTTEQIQYLKSSLEDSPFVEFNPYPLDEGTLFRRALGRNEVALATRADVVWFADVDMLFGENCLSVAHELAMTKPGLYMPCEVQISFDNNNEWSSSDRPHHEVGRVYIDSHRDDPCPTIKPEFFGGPWTGPCIGGVQIVHGDVARRGYLSGTSFVQKTVDPSQGFRSCIGDKKYRKWLTSLGVPGPIKLEIPNCYRIRHLVDGRDFLANGTRLEGKEAW